VTLRRIVLCADDYALAPGVSRSIRELITRGRLNATSVMTVFPGLREEAARLVETQSPIRFETGLHVTLTGGFKPLKASPLKTSDGNFPAVKDYLHPLNWPKVSRATAAEEIEAQMLAFRNAFGRMPDFVDGHQHVQLMPPLRSAFLETVAKLAPRAWVRQCGPVSVRQLPGADPKTRFLALLNAGFRSQARARGLVFNTAFAGAYDFTGSRDYAGLFEEFLKGMPSGGLIMCHPGFVDDGLRARDPLLEQREAEHKFFASDNLPTLLARHGVTLG
jgi:predicted glycoside hydrolase/deacetylase ChbG (UPF0249 family)